MNGSETRISDRGLPESAASGVVLNNGNSSSHCAGGWKSNSKVLAGPAPSGTHQGAPTPLPSIRWLGSQLWQSLAYSRVPLSSAIVTRRCPCVSLSSHGHVLEKTLVMLD